MSGVGMLQSGGPAMWSTSVYKSRGISVPPLQHSTCIASLFGDYCFVFEENQRYGTSMNALDDYYALRSEFRKSVAQTYLGLAGDVPAQARAGSIKLLDALTLRELLQKAKPKTVLEIGSFLGFSTRWILESTQETEAHVTAIDPRVSHRIFQDPGRHMIKFVEPFKARTTVRRAFLSQANYNVILASQLKNQKHKGDAVEILNALKAIEVITSPFDTFEFAFVDGEHSYPATVKNVALVSQMIAPGGLIVVHDAISWPQVEPALRDLCSASKGALELTTIVGKGMHADMKPFYERRMTKENANHACVAVCDGLGVLRVVQPWRTAQDTSETLAKNWTASN